jgi:hypothetical protein
LCGKFSNPVAQHSEQEIPLICTPAIVRAASLMPVRGLPLQFLNPERRIPKTVGEWYQQCFYNNLDNDLRAGRAMTYGPISGKTISVAEGYRIVAHARAEGWLPPALQFRSLIRNEFAL